MAFALAFVLLSLVPGFPPGGAAETDRATRPLFRGAGTGRLIVEGAPEAVSLEFYAVQCVEPAPGGGTFSVTRSGDKAQPPTLVAGQLYTESKTGVTFRIEPGDVDFAPADSFSFVTYRRNEDLEKFFDDWVNRYVKWILSREEREQMFALTAAEDKLAFMEGFWRRRDPTPETPRNERREEHQRRYQYALQHFGAGTPGWATDRGKVYILLGAPHSIQRNPTGRTSFERPSEVWTYNNPPNPRLPASLDVAFVDFTATGRYEIVSATNLDLLAPLRTNIGYAMSELEAIGLLRSGGEVQEQTTGVRTAVDPTRMATEFFDWERDLREIERVADVERRPLTESITAQAAFPSLPLTATAVFLPRDGGALVPVTLSLPYARLTPEPEGKDFRFSADVLLQVRGTSEGGAPVEDRLVVVVPGGEISRYREDTLLYETALTLSPGRYTLEAFLRDVPTGAYGRASLTIDVPDRAAESGLGLSSLILASGAFDSPEAADGSVRAPFQFGSVRLVPNPLARFRTGTKLTAYVEACRYARESGTARLRVEFFILKDGRLYSKVVPSLHSPTSLDRTSIKSEISLAGFPAGSYVLRVRVTDEVAGTRSEQDASFTLES